MLEKQSQMHQHANCLEMMLSMLAKADHLNTICPYSELLEMTPTKDDYFTWQSYKKPTAFESENL